MPARQVARFPLLGGMDTKSDEKHVPIPKLEIAKNVDLSTPGAIVKRRALATTGGGAVGTLVGGGRRIEIEDVNPQLATPGNGVRSMAPNGSDMVSGFGGCPATSSRVIAAQKIAEMQAIDVAEYGGDIYCAVAVYKPAGTYDIECVQIDAVTGERLNATNSIFSGVPVTTTNLNMRIVAIPGHGVMVCYEDPASNDTEGRLYYDGEWRSTFTLWTGTTSGQPFDVCVDSTGDRLFLAVVDGASVYMRGYDITGTGYFITLTQFGQQSQGYTNITAISCALDEAGGWVTSVFSRSTPEIRALVYPDTVVSVDGAQLSTATPVGTYDNLAVVVTANSKATAIWGELDPADAHPKLVVKSFSLHTTTSAVIDDTHEMYACGLIHRPVLIGTFIYFGIVRPTNELETQYVTLAFSPHHVNSRPWPVASYNWGTAIPAADIQAGMMSHAVAAATPTGIRYWWGAPVRNELRADDSGVVHSNLSAALNSWDMSAEALHSHAAAHDALLVAGGIPTALVGDYAVATGFVQPPEVIAVAGAVAGGGMAAGTTHTVKVVYEFMDGRGRIWQSAPSSPENVTLGGGDDAITVEVLTPVTEYPASLGGRGITSMQVGVYMTTNGGTLYYRSSPYVGTGTNANVCFQTVESVTVTVTDADATIETQEILYTDAGLLRHDPPPPCVAVVEHKQRFAAIHAETGDIWLTQLFARGEGVHWSQVLVVSNPDPADMPTALASTDAALVVFYRNRIGFIYGEGPNNQGGGQPFTPIQFLPDADVGAISQKTLAKIPMGIFFCDGDKGWHVLPYGGGVAQYVGVDMDGSPTEVIVGTAHLPDRQEVRAVFYDADTYAGEAACWVTWHYATGQWSIGYADDHTAANAYALADGNEFIIDGVGEDTTAGYDASATYVEMRVRTGWITMQEASRKQGLHRLWQLYLMAEPLDEHDLSAILYYDYDGAAGGTGLSLPARDVGDVEGVRIDPGKQLIEAFKLDIVDEETAGTSTGEGYRLTDLEIHFGLYPGVKPRRAGAGRMTAV